MEYQKTQAARLEKMCIGHARDKFHAFLERYAQTLRDVENDKAADTVHFVLDEFRRTFLLNDK